MSPALHPAIRAVFFDAVGTLLFPDPPAPEVYTAAATRQGVVLPAGLVRERFLAAYQAEEAVDRTAVWVTSEEREHDRWRRIVTAALTGIPDPDAAFRELFEHFSRPSAWRVNPDAAAAFATLHDRGLALGLASNYDARLLSVLAGHAALAPVADRVVVSAALGWRKPSPQFFQEVLRVARCEANEALYVGDDMENDYRGATDAGMKAVLLDPGEHAAAGVCRIACLSELEAP